MTAMSDRRYSDKGLGDHNYCRNPQESYSDVWCYTESYQTRWDFCDVPNCGKFYWVISMYYVYAFQILLLDWCGTMISMSLSGGGIHPLLNTFSRMPHKPMCCNDKRQTAANFPLFWHVFCPITHYGMVSKSWNLVENNSWVNIHTIFMLLEAHFSGCGTK